MSDITVIILTKNEEKNIKASIISSKQIAERIIVVDSGSNDKTIEIAKELGAEVYYHEWEGHAKQFNWALDNCSVKTEWVFRLDIRYILLRQQTTVYSDLLIRLILTESILRGRLTARKQELFFTETENSTVQMYVEH